MLQALLFCAQSFGEPTPVINGDLVRLGEANDVIRDGMEQTTLEFAYPDISREGPGHRPTESPRALRLTLNPRDQGRSLAMHELSLWQEEQCLFKAAAAAEPTKELPRGEDEQALQVVEPGSFNLPSQSYLIVAGITPTRLLYEADQSELENDFRALIDTGRGHHFPLEELVRLARNTVSDEATSSRLAAISDRVTRGDLGGITPQDRDLLFDEFQEVVAPSGWMSEPIAPMGRPRAFWAVGTEAQDEKGPALLARELGRGLDQVDRLAAAVLYLGPLRDDPRVAYPLGHTVRALPVGEKGEFTAAYLRENRAARFRFGKPDGSDSHGLLTSAVNQWCEYLGIADRIEVNTQGKLGHVLGLQVGGQSRDPTAIGVGASQLLPVVVLVLGAPEGSIVLLEQPELHLHPGVQSRLADFLAYARRNIRIVVETHSEYLLTRLRLRIAEGDLAPGELAVLFATQQETTEEPGSLHTEFEHLNLDELGDLNRWPRDFFDSLDRDSVDLAQAIARKLRTDEASST